MSRFRLIANLRGGCEQRRWRCTRLEHALAQLQNKLVDLIVLELGDGIFKHEFLGQHAHRKAEVLAGVLCVEVLQGLLALAHVGTGRHWLTPMRKDVLEDAASQFVACAAGSSGMTRLETFPTHLTPFVPVAARAPLPRLASEMPIRRPFPPPAGAADRGSVHDAPRRNAKCPQWPPARPPTRTDRV